MEVVIEDDETCSHNESPKVRASFDTQDDIETCASISSAASPKLCASNGVVEDEESMVRGLTAHEDRVLTAHEDRESSMDVTNKVPASDRWALFPAIKQTCGIAKQHIQSFNIFVSVTMTRIVTADVNRFIRSNLYTPFFIEFKRVHLMPPSIPIEHQLPVMRGGVCSSSESTPVPLLPNACRLRGLTYSSRIMLECEVYRGPHMPIARRQIDIGDLPVMLGSSLCHLSSCKGDDDIIAMGECPLDPRGYFIVRGNEKVILMQEQQTRNRIIIEKEPLKGLLCATTVSSSWNSRSRLQVILNQNRKVYVRHNAFIQDVPLAVVMKAFGVVCDQEILSLIAADSPDLMQVISLSLQDLISIHGDPIITQTQAIRELSYFIRPKFSFAHLTISEKKNLIKSRVENSNINHDDEANIHSVLDLIHRILLSHVRGDLRSRCQYLAIMCRRLLEASLENGSSDLIDDKDYYGNKRLELAGDMLGYIFEDKFKLLRERIEKKANDLLKAFLAKRGETSLGFPDCLIPSSIDRSIISQGMVQALATGNWIVRRFRMEKSGVSQMLNRFSIIASLAMLTRVNSPVDASMKMTKPRHLQPSHFGVLCPSDSPEGENIGLIKALALLTQVTPNDENEPRLERLAHTLGVETAGLLTGEEMHDSSATSFLVFLNGTLLGVHKRPSQFIENLRFLRRRGCLNPFVSIYDNPIQRSVYIASDGGRVCRPLIILDSKGQSKLSKTILDQVALKELHFDDLINNGVVEWVDVNEENSTLIALKESDIIPGQSTHLEIDPLGILGTVAGLIPYPHHNQSPRNAYQCAMGKQAMGAFACNQYIRADNIQYLLVYPQKPIVTTRTIELMSLDKLPAGHNASLAVMSFGGYDIEDALVMNKSSLDRGFGRCQVFRTHTYDMKVHGAYEVMTNSINEKSPILERRALRQCQIDASNRNIGGLRERLRIPIINHFVPPPPCHRDPRTDVLGRLGFRMACLEQDGLAAIGVCLHEGQIFANKVAIDEPTMQILARSGGEYAVSIKEGRTSKPGYYSSPLVHKLPDPAVLDRLILTTGSQGELRTKFVFRQTRVPELGDKFSSRHGQKGVLGAVVASEDMPFAQDGWQPDVVMNPHGFPSRMTVGKLLETIAGKAASLDGRKRYGTAFGGTKLEDIASALTQAGYCYTGKDYMTSGTSGEALESYVFTGTVFYQKLKHMVQDKIQARGIGPRHHLTRQPIEGRAKHGGMRMGEMERDCLVAYGSADVLRERLLLSSDRYDLSVCERCGLIVGKPGMSCRMCKDARAVRQVMLPYACKLLFQELMAMNVCPRLTLRPVV